MQKIATAVLFGGTSPEHEVSLRSAQSVLNSFDSDKYELLPVGITKEGRWYLYSGDYNLLPGGAWEHEENLKVPAAILPVRGAGLALFHEDGTAEVRRLDCVFPVLHGKDGEDGSVQGLLQLAGIPCVGSGLSASAFAMDKTSTKLVADLIGIRQAAWKLVRAAEIKNESTLDDIAGSFEFPVFVKPAGTGSSVGVSKVSCREELRGALESAAQYDNKILVEEFIEGQEVEVAVLGNEDPVAAEICGEIDSGDGFYDYDAKYISEDRAKLHIPARISEEAAAGLRRMATEVYAALGCAGLARVDFFVKPDGELVFNEINTIPGFTSISMYPKLFEASGLPYPELLDRLVGLALEGGVNG